ncbi:MAG: TerB family tellurite resistance protein [Acidobacteriota bacterium]
MIEAIRSFFDDRIGRSPSQAEDPEHSVRLAAAALFAELIGADFHHHPEERRTALAAIQKALELPREEADALLDLAEDEASISVSLYEFTRLVHQHFSEAEKLRVVEGLWRVAYADGRLDHHEDHMLRKVKSLLHIPQAAFIEAKLRAREQHSS